MKRLFIILMLIIGTVSASHATVWKVGNTHRYKRIADAIRMASDMDTVMVFPGVYREGNLLINKSIVLLGIQGPVLDGENQYEVLSVRAHRVHIEGFRLINSGVSSMTDLAGIGVENADHVIVRNNKLENTFFGIHFSNSHHAVIEGNTVVAQPRPEHHTGNGIHLWQCRQARIRNNEIRRHRDGIYFEFVTESVIDNNHSESNLRYGLHFMFSHQDQYRGNVFKGNGAGVAVMYSHHVTMLRNVFEENWGASAYGLLLKDISDSHIERNEFRRNTTGIWLEGTNRGRFQNNTFFENGWAIKLQANCDGNDFTANNFISNTFDIATNGTLVLNTFNQNYWDRYEGYDLDKNGMGDVPFRPVSLYAMVVERVPVSVMLWRSFLVFLLDRSERVMPAVTPENLKDNSPRMKPYDFDTPR
jgi:nitrous oxidase accessory protein